LRTAFFRRTCPDSVRLGEYVLDLLPPEGRRAVAEHLLECPHCAAERRSLTAFLATPDPPPAEGPFAALRRLVARVLPVPASALAALRGEGESNSLTFEADGMRVIVSV